MVFNSDGDLYFSEELNRIKKLSNGQVTTLAGNEANGYSGDGTLAQNAQVNLPSGLAIKPGTNFEWNYYNNYTLGLIWEALMEI